MEKRSGAGASVSSGASYQARVGAYVVATSICEQTIDLCLGSEVKSVAFETLEPIDDINIELKNGMKLYVQAKSKIDYSKYLDSELGSVFKQFWRQYKSSKANDCRFFLVTGSQSSRKVLYDARVSLDAFRLGEEENFRRDQNAAIIAVLNELTELVKNVQEEDGDLKDEGEAKSLLRRSSIVCLDLEQNDPIVQAVILILGSKNFIAPSLFWGRIVSDCVSYSKRRNSLLISVAKQEYQKYKSLQGNNEGEFTDDNFEIIREGTIPVGREIILCNIPNNKNIPEVPKVRDSDETTNGSFVANVVRASVVSATASSAEPSVNRTTLPRSVTICLSPPSSIISTTKGPVGTRRPGLFQSK
jgi:hypothetical protein